MKTWGERGLLVLLWLALGIVTGGAGGFEYPDLDGFTRAGEPDRYDPETLYEYINGKAGSFLDYGFEELLALVYTGDDGKLIRADLYRHRDPAHAFGIFTSERPRKPGEIVMNGAGYLKKSKLSFHRGDHYVKLEGENLGEQPGAALLDLGERILALLPGEPGPPANAACLPAESQEPHSLRYIARGFLGHGFLHSAFTADYETEAGSHRAFLIVAADEPEALAMRDAYLELARSKGQEPTESDGRHRLFDPYRKAEGALNLSLRGRCLAGVFLDDEAAAARFLDAVWARVAALED